MKRNLLGLVTVALVCAATAPAAWAGGEIQDPCGLGSTSTFLGASIYPEPQIPWLDVCSADVSGVDTGGPMRAVRTSIHLDGDVASAQEAGTAYWVYLLTDHCGLWQQYNLYPGQGAATYLQGQCDFTEEPCPFPESEVPNTHCGSSTQIYIQDSVAEAVSAFGKTVTLTFDPNQLQSVPTGLAIDLSPGGVLNYVGVQTGIHEGVQGVVSDALGPGGDTAQAPGAIALG